MKKLLFLAPLALLVTGCPDDTAGLTNTDLNQAVADHASQQSAHHTKTTDAAEITTGVLADAQIPTGVARVADLTPGVIRTKLPYIGVINDTTITGTFELMRTVGNFDKVDAASDIEIFYEGHIEALLSAGGTTFCDVQVRIDGNEDADMTGRAVTSQTAEFGVPYAMRAQFSGLTAGTHTVELWVRGVAAQCRDNPGNFPHAVYVYEYAP